MYIKIGLLGLSPCICVICFSKVNSCYALLYILLVYGWYVLIIQDDTCGYFLKTFYLVQVIVDPVIIFFIFHFYNSIFNCKSEYRNWY